MSRGLTFLAVHAHPDDEASSTGGTFPLLADQGVRTILVTCTNGECGDDPNGLKPEHDDHDGDLVAEVRRGELDRAVEILNISRHERLGFRDSGMMGWADNIHPKAFWNQDPEVACLALVEILREERPQVIMTYNAFGFYGHPDHIQAHRITIAALAHLDYEPTVYFNAIPTTVMNEMRARWRQEAIDRGEEPGEESPDLSTPESEIAVSVDIAPYSGTKFDALAAHRSQIGENSGWMKMGRDGFRERMVTEWFVRATNPLHLSEPATDIFVGYR